MLSPKLKKVLQLAACIVFSIWLFVKGVIPGWTQLHSDFGNYYTSARLVVTGVDLGRLYDNEWFHEQMTAFGVNTPGKFSPFPPATAWIMIPLTGFDALTAQRIFLIVNLLFIFVTAWAWKNVSGWTQISSMLIVLAGGTSLSNNIGFGQLYLVVTAGMLWAIVLMKNGRPVAGGIVLGILAVLKYFPITVIGGILLYWFSVNEKDVRKISGQLIVASLSAIIALIALQSVFFGNEVMVNYFTSAFLPHLSSELSGQGMFSYLFQSWDSFARQVFVYDPQFNSDPWINWPAGKTILKMFITALVLFTVVVVLYRFRHSVSRMRIFIAVLALAAMVLLPASATYHFILLLLPLGMMTNSDIVTNRNWTIACTLFVAIGFIPYQIFFSLADRWGLIFAYPRLWLVTFLFFFVMIALVRRSSRPSLR